MNEDALRRAKYDFETPSTRARRSACSAPTRTGRPCEGLADYEEDGKRYCWQHLPSRINAALEKKRRQEEEESRRRFRVYSVSCMTIICTVYSGQTGTHWLHKGWKWRKKRARDIDPEFRDLDQAKAFVLERVRRRIENCRATIAAAEAAIDRIEAITEDTITEYEARP